MAIQVATVTRYYIPWLYRQLGDPVLYSLAIQVSIVTGPLFLGNKCILCGSLLLSLAMKIPLVTGTIFVSYTSSHSDLILYPLAKPIVVEARHNIF